MIQGHSLFSSSGLIRPLDFGQTLFSRLWLPKQTCFWVELDAEVGCREKKELSACGCILSCLFLGFFSSDSYFISQGWSLQLNVHPVYITCNKPRDSHTVLSPVSSSVTQQLEEIRVSSFSLALWQGNQISSLLLLSHL